MLTLKQLLLLTTVGLGALTLQACTDDGPLENAGEQLDRAADNAADAIEEACTSATDSDCDVN